MIEAAVFVLRSLLSKFRTSQPTKTETFTTFTQSARDARDWHNQRVQSMIDAFPQSHATVRAERISRDVKLNQPSTPVSFGTIPGVKKTQTTVTYTTGPPQTVFK